MDRRTSISAEMATSEGPKKYKISTSKFIEVRRDASDLIVIQREREPRSLSRNMSQYSHLLPKIGKLELKLLMSY